MERAGVFIITIFSFGTSRLPGVSSAPGRIGLSHSWLEHPHGCWSRGQGTKGLSWETGLRLKEQVGAKSCVFRQGIMWMQGYPSSLLWGTASGFSVPPWDRR